MRMALPRDDQGLNLLAFLIFFFIFDIRIKHLLNDIGTLTVSIDIECNLFILFYLLLSLLKNTIKLILFYIVLLLLSFILLFSIIFLFVKIGSIGISLIATILFKWLHLRYIILSINPAIFHFFVHIISISLIFVVLNDLISFFSEMNIAKGFSIL